MFTRIEKYYKLPVPYVDYSLASLTKNSVFINIRMKINVDKMFINHFFFTKNFLNIILNCCTRHYTS